MKGWIPTLLLLAPVRGGDPTSTARVDPHRDPGRCASCHEDSPTGVGPALPIAPTCRGCHEDADMHPVEVDPGEIAVPDAMPRGPDGRLTCWTCHAEPACGTVGDLPPPYLRGGPFANIALLCFRCHARESYRRSNPHHPEMDRVAGLDWCSACHTGRPELGARPDDARLRPVDGGVCHSCHDPYPHQGTTRHVGARLDPEVVAQLPPEVAVDGEGRVQCWSCHEVHGRPPPADPHWPEDSRLSRAMTAFVLDRMAEREQVAWVPPMGQGKPGHVPMLALPDDDGTLCRACHHAGGRP